jgi:hypothetical protein
MWSSVSEFSWRHWVKPHKTLVSRPKLKGITSRLKTNNVIDINPAELGQLLFDCFTFMTSGVQKSVSSVYSL